MKPPFLFFFVAVCGVGLIGCQHDTVTPPGITKIPATDTYFGLEINDPYRNLEDIEDTTVIDWIHKENKTTELVLNKVSGKKELIEKQRRYDQKRNFVISDVHITENQHIFYLKRNNKENVSSLYYRKRTDEKEILLFNPADYKPEPNITRQVNYFSPNWDGSKVVISITKDEDEYSQMIIMDVETKEILPHIIGNCKPTGIGGVNWLPDNASFSYVHIPNATEKNGKTTLNTKAVIYEIEKDTKGFREVLSRDTYPELVTKPEDFSIVFADSPHTDYVLGVVRGSSPYFDGYYIPTQALYTKKPVWKPLFKKIHQLRNCLIDNDSIIYLTAKNAPNFTLCKTSIEAPDFDHPQVLVEEKKGEIIKYFAHTDQGLFFTTVINGVQAKLYRLHHGKEVEIPLPKSSADIKLSRKGNDLVVALKGWLSKTEYYLFNFETGRLDRYDVFPDSFCDPFDDLIVEEITVPSHDGAEVPLSLVYKKGTKRNGNTPVLMRGYGAYGTSMVPNSYYPFLLYAREGGIYAVAHVRGGGEKGDAWYKGGHKTTKPNTWKDLIACTEYLIDKKYTSKGKVAIWSGSAGGILVGRAMTDRPDLFSAVIIDRGMLNTIRLENGINGANSAKEFGTVKDSIEFKGLLAMDSYHHIKKGTQYPATLITTGMNDSRVPSWQSMKFAAKLQEANASDHPILLQTEFDAGHALQFTKEKAFERYANAFSFAFWQTGHPEYQPE